ncbi:MAG: hypothetical protein A3F80_05580 [Candidatus Melainabacteria bacterium RIFCSPLOWO2_12_FULL_35_11]|nr:MAG: hypothetical protein A3F80_05580 [Candidatus Melainabacteria bacterium RIFCSPLOWO2_12_FULL_35_11]
MKSNIGHQQFTKISIFTFIVYFIAAICGHFNFLAAWFFNRHYFPLKSYLITFNDSKITNIENISKSIYNLAGYKALINTNIPYKLIDDLFFVFISSSLIILFFLGYKIVQSNTISHGAIIKWAVLFSVLMTVSIPSHSSDLFGYIARGAQQSIYHQNPYLETVDNIKDYRFNRMLCNFSWPHQPTTYGPVFIFITKAIVYLSNNNFLISFINFKLLNLTLYFLLILFVSKLNQTKDLFLIAWNPLILIQGLWNCHNDLVSGVFIFLGIYMLLKSKNNNKYFWSIFSLVFAFGIKYVSALIISVIMFYFLQKRTDAKVFVNLLLGFCSGLLLVLIFSMDYLISFRDLSISSSNELISNLDLVHQSLIAAVFTVIKYICNLSNLQFNPDKLQFILKSSFYITFLVFYFWILFKKKTNLIFEITLVLFIFIAFTLAKFHSWYLLNLIVLIPFLQPCFLKNILIALSLSHVYALTFLDQAKILNFVSMTMLPVLFMFFKEKRKEGSL